MSFNCPKFIKEFKQYVGDLQVKAILEVGSYSGELKNAVGADGIDIPKLRSAILGITKLINCMDLCFLPAYLDITTIKKQKQLSRLWQN